MRNTYPGICYRCKKTCKEGEGHFELIPKNQRRIPPRGFQAVRWRLQHAACAIQHRATKLGKENDNDGKEAHS